MQNLQSSQTLALRRQDDRGIDTTFHPIFHFSRQEPEKRGTLVPVEDLVTAPYIHQNFSLQ